jgi:TatD family-associated radical SAM protein
MKGKIAYRFETPAYPGDILYVNMIANYACSCDCTFCGRPRDRKTSFGGTIYEKKAGTPLFLPKSPSVNEVMTAIDANVKDDDKELAIIGLGEPLIYLPKVLEVLKQVKEQYGLNTRVDTNGLVRASNHNVVEQLSSAGLDQARISLNATNAEDYNSLCNPKVQDAFQYLVSFVRECERSDIETFVSFVTQHPQSRPEQEYIEFAQSLGIPLERIILREYMDITNV